MRTLDEVIKAMELCTTYPEDDEMCPGCPYADADGNPECVGQDKEDALHYLKEYRDYREKVEHLHDACEHCLYSFDCHLDPECPYIGLEEYVQ